MTSWPYPTRALRASIPHTVRHEGAAQICLIGPPNSGKSSLHATLTASKAETGPFPYTTREPLPGMLHFEDIAFQLVDLPPIASGRTESWLVNLLGAADAVWFVVDLADPACADQVVAVSTELAEHKITLSERWPALSPTDTAERSAAHAQPSQGNGAGESSDPFQIQLPTLLLANKSDLDPDPDEVGVLEELSGVRFPAMAVSAQTGQGLEGLAPFLFKALGIVRVYTKPPGHPADKTRPFVVHLGGTVSDVARLVHQDLARSLKFARLWGHSAFEGQHVGPDHPVADGDIVELHAK
jgi:ribosome-interacting GTPase 1